MAIVSARGTRRARVKQLVEVNDLTGGVDLRRSQTLLGANRARLLRNYSLEEPGALTVRPGYVVASSASLGSGRAQGGQRVYLASTAFTLVAWNGRVYNPTDAWVWGAAVGSTLSTANQISFPFDRDIVAAMDGTNRPLGSVNGSSWWSLGINPPGSGLSLSSGVLTAGLSSGEYAIAHTFKHRATAFEGSVGPESTITITSTGNGKIVVAAPTSTDAKVDAYVLYARHVLPDGEAVLRYVSSQAIANGSTITSSAWTSGDEAPSDHTVPPDGLLFATAWKSRWWAPSGTTRNRLHFSELFLPQAWPSNYYVDIPFVKGDRIAAVQSLGDTLIVFGQSGEVFLVIGQTSLDFEVRPSIGSDGGAFGPRAVVPVEQALVHLGHHGVMTFDGSSDRPIDVDIKPAMDDLIANTAAATLARVAAVFDPKRREVRVTVPRVYPTGTLGEWVLNLDRMRENGGVPAWVTTDRDIAFYIPWDGNEPTAGNQHRLFSMPSTAGLVFEENTGTTANSSNMTAEYEGPALSLGLHRARIVDIHVEYEPHGGAFTAETVVDGVTQGGIAFSIGSGLAAYGTATYGTSVYGGAGRRKAYSPLPISADGRAVVLKTSYIGQEAFTQYTYAYGVLPEVTIRQVSE